MYRIAASKSSPWRHDRTCPVPSSPSSSLTTNDAISNHDENEKIRKTIHRFRNILERSRYNNENVQHLFGIRPRNESLHELKLDADMSSVKKETMLSFAQSPIYIKPVSAGTQSKLPSLLDDFVDSKTNGVHKTSALHPIDNSTEKKEVDYESSLKCLTSLFLLGFAGK